METEINSPKATLEPKNSGSEQSLEPIKKHRKSKKLPVFVSIDDLNALLRVSKHKHHKFAYMMGWYSGMRISEILNLEPRDVDTAKGTVFVRQGSTWQ